MVEKRASDLKAITLQDLTKGVSLFTPSVKERVEKYQSSQFKLAPGLETSGWTIERVASELLEREYGETMIFKSNNKSVFIPQEFISDLYYEDISILDHQIETWMKKTLKNMKQNRPASEWFTVELDKFLKTIDSLSDQKNYVNLDWIKQIKVLYILRRQTPDQTNYPKVEESLEEFLKFYQRQLKDEIGFLKMYDNYQSLTDRTQQNKCFRKWCKKQLMSLKEIPEIFQWFFHLSTDIRGERAEKWLFQELVTALGDEDMKPFVVLHGANIMIPGGIQFNSKRKYQQEYDFLLFSPELKIVIAIEVKYALLDEKYFDQLEAYQQIFEEKFGNKLKDWTYFPVLFEYSEQTRALDTLHYINSTIKLKEWLHNVSSSLTQSVVVSEEHAYESLRNVLQLFYFAFHISKFYLGGKQGPLVNSKYYDWILETIKQIGKSQNILFYSPGQLPILLDNRFQKILIRGGFGSGKSILLQKKCEMIASEGENAVYFICTGTKKKTLFQLTLEEKWKGNPNITVDALKNEFDVEDLLKHGHKHVFIDECCLHLIWRWIDKDNNIKSDIIQLINTRFSHLWISTSKIPLNYYLDIFRKHFKYCELNMTFRKTKKITDRAFGMSDAITPLNPNPPNFPSGPSVTVLDDFRCITANSLVLFHKSQRRYVSMIFQELVSTKCLDFEVALYTDIDEMNDLFKEYVIESKNCLAFLEDKKTLFVDEDLVAGFEWPNVVVVENIVQGHSQVTADLITRAITNLCLLNSNMPDEK